jgi:hypothetical protein
LGTLGDPADLIVCKTTTMQGAAVRSAAPFRLGFAQWNNASRDVLMSDKSARRTEKCRHKSIGNAWPMSAL